MIEIKQKFVLVMDNDRYCETYDSADYVYDTEKNPCAVLVSLNGKWGLVDLDGSVKVPVTYIFAKCISNNMVIFRSIIGKCGLFDVISMRWALIDSHYDLINSNYLINDDFVIVNKGIKRGLFNTNRREWVLFPEYDYIGNNFETINIDFKLKYAFIDADGCVIFTVNYGYSEELGKSVKCVTNSVLNGYKVTDYSNNTFNT
jgi:hypothetical protein